MNKYLLRTYYVQNNMLEKNLNLMYYQDLTQIVTSQKLLKIRIFMANSTSLNFSINIENRIYYT